MFTKISKSANIAGIVLITIPAMRNHHEECIRTSTNMPSIDGINHRILVFEFVKFWENAVKPVAVHHEAWSQYTVTLNSLLAASGLLAVTYFHMF